MCYTAPPHHICSKASSIVVASSLPPLPSPPSPPLQKILEETRTRLSEEAAKKQLYKKVLQALITQGLCQLLEPEVVVVCRKEDVEAVKVWGWGQSVEGWGLSVEGWGLSVEGWGLSVEGWGLSVEGWGLLCRAQSDVQGVLDAAAREYKQVAQKDCKLVVSSEQYLPPDRCVGGGSSSP